ncbi:hypothetical protein [Streptomyces sp. NPDC127072]|uniref:hypothetical protein n=1 Tax=Streptomyces sp. NPDC127072 TaxID=3347129 RepID=UPI00364A2267
MTTAPPTPPDTDAAAFMAALRRLKAWSGLSYRRLERHATEAGHCLPYSTAATMLGRDRLPREELLAAFVAACGIRGDEAQAWLNARTDLACGPVPIDATPTNIAPTGIATAPATSTRTRTRTPNRPWRTRWTLVGAAALLTLLLGGATASGAFTDDEEVLQTPVSARL